MPNRRLFLKSMIILPLLPLTLSACGKSSNKNAKLPKNAKVIALGDSLTFGYGATQGASYPDILAQKTGWLVDNMGVNGDTSQNVLDRLDLVIQAKPDLVLLGIGGNDVLRRIAPAITQDNLNQIIDRLKEHQIDVILIAQPHFSASALFGKASDNPVYQKVANQQNVALLDKVWSKILSDDKLKSDQIHANDAGYAYFADEMYQFLQKQGYL